MTAFRRALFVQVAEPGAYPPVINAAFLLAESGWDVTVLGSPFAAMALTMPQHPRITVKMIRQRRDFVVSKASFAEYCLSTMALTARLRPSLIYVSDPIGAVPGLLSKALVGRRSTLVYHEHDSPGASDHQHPLVARARRAIAHGADIVVFPNAARADCAVDQLQLTREKVFVVWNVPRRAELPAAIVTATEPTILYYHGSINPSRLPVSLFHAAATCASRVVVRIAGYETDGGGYIARLEQEFGRADDGGLIDFIGQVERHDLLSRAARAHVGLAFMPMESPDINMRSMAGASNKAFDYMAAGLPLIVSDLPDWRKTFVDPGYAIAADPTNEASLQAAIGHLIKDAPSRIAMGECNRRKIADDWNYDTQFAPILSFLNNANRAHRVQK